VIQTATIVSEPPAERRRLAQLTLRPFTTPGQLRLGMVVLVIATAVFGLVAVRSVVRRLDAARTVGTVASPQLTAAQDVYVSLADADAAASSAFLKAGSEPPALQQRYRDDISRASAQLPAMAQRTKSAAAASAVTTITNQMPVYAGLVESAHANALQSHTLPVAAAYLHEASLLMRNTILPAATVVYSDATSQLADADRAGSSPAEIAAVWVLGLVLLGLLGAMLVYLAVRTRRTLNLGVGIAAIVIAVLIAITTVAFVREQDALRRAQSRGSDPLQVLSVARILTLRSFSDENLDLVERGATTGYQADFKGLANRLHDGRGTGLLDTRSASPSLVSDFESYYRQHGVVSFDNYHDGNYVRALNVATSDEARTLSNLDTELGRQVDAARARLETNARHARNGLAFVAVLAGLLALAAAVAIVLGLRPRIREYA
jgi:hypothetical protein